MAEKRKIAGVDVLLKVTDGDGELQVVGGQTDATLNREAETIDTTDKTSGGFASAMAGVISWSVEAEGFVVLGDNSFDLIEETFLERKPFKVEIRVGEDNDTNGRTYSGNVYITDLPLDFAQDDAVTYSLTLEGDGVLDLVKGEA